MIIIRETTTFKIPPKLKPFTQISGDLKNFKNWHSKIFIGNSVSRKELKYDDTLIGYIAISLKSNILVPIARGDEHHNGNDLIDYLIDNKKLIPEDDYFTVYPMHPLFTFYDGPEQFNREIAEKVALIQKCVDYGLNTGTEMMIVCYGLADKDGRWEGPVSDFLKYKGRVILKQKDQKSKGINPDGLMIIKMLRDFAMGCNYLRANPHANIEVLFDKATDYADKITGFFMKAEKNHITDELIKLKKEIYKVAYKTPDEKEVERLFFSITGIKNEIHNGIRTALSAFTTSETKAIQLVFGDVKKAMQEFQALGQI